MTTIPGIAFSIYKVPPSLDGGTSTLFLRRYKLQKITNFALKDRTQSSQNVNIQSCDLVVTIVIDLSALHFCTMAQFILADASIFNQFVQIDTNCSILCHTRYTCTCRNWSKQDERFLLTDIVYIS